MRIRFPREFYIPKGAVKIARKTIPAVVYIKEGDGIRRPEALGFYGKADKPAFHHSFKDNGRRNAFVAQWFKNMEEVAARKEARKAEKRAFKHSLQVGDIMRTSWGYDQTNIEYFQVTGLIGASMVEVREIAQESEETGYMQGKCVPVPGKFIGKPLRKRVLEGNVLDIHGGFGYASKEPGQVVGGVKVYSSSHWTAYA